ncbi:hypothetical protein COO91_10379 (plasmid) [Nostoc flagelliforme CCNUN1]|uniref:Uncharacterized protein n=1 Tax=Nostoc flagelliforme CCNUN1 TaxID=2038116 RepID=A0A2K8T932_9NOSO|nr:hypothetical protein COO91_10379 [Nostoc flagelliforme CCNUN1]
MIVRHPITSKQLEKFVLLAFRGRNEEDLFLEKFFCFDF